MARARYPDFNSQELKNLVAGRLRFWILQRGYRSIELFAHECGINKGNISKNIRAIALPSLNSLLRMAEVLEIALDDLLIDTAEYLAERERTYVEKSGGQWEDHFPPRQKKKQ